jgi:putative membrane protein
MKEVPATSQRVEAEPAYADAIDKELILRDVLAIDRTVLANERTLMAYIRTALALFLTGASSLHLPALNTAYLAFSNLFYDIFGWLMVASSGLVAFVGYRRFREEQKRIHVARDHVRR